MVSGYSLACGCTLLTAARLGTVFGRRRVFRTALAGFAAASALCALAVTAPELVAARIVQGIAGAAMSAQTITVLTELFPSRLLG